MWSGEGCAEADDDAHPIFAEHANVLRIETGMCVCASSVVGLWRQCTHNSKMHKLFRIGTLHTAHAVIHSEVGELLWLRAALLTRHETRGALLMCVCLRTRRAKRSRERMLCKRMCMSGRCLYQRVKARRKVQRKLTHGNCALNYL